jgi:hypothetical protein
MVKRRTLAILVGATTMAFTGISSSGCASVYINQEYQKSPSTYIWRGKEEDKPMIYLQTYGNLEEGIREAIIHFCSDNKKSIVVDEKRLNGLVDSAFIYIGRDKGIVKSGDVVRFPAPKI